jgi:hypothetical protein
MTENGKCELLHLIPRARPCPSMGIGIRKETILTEPSRPTPMGTKTKNKVTCLLAGSCSESSSRRRPELGLILLISTTDTVCFQWQIK